MERTEGPDSHSPRPSRDKRNHRPRPSQSRTVLVSKALSRLLRHQAQNERIPITSDGWVRLDHILAWKGLNARGGSGGNENSTVDDIWTAVEENDKKRFAVRYVGKENTGKIDETTISGTGISNTIVSGYPSNANPTHSQTTMQNTSTSPSVNETSQKQALPQLSTESTDTADSNASPVDHASDSETASAISIWRSGHDTNTSHFLLRATQGHSIKTITSTTELLHPITLDDPTSIPTTCVHGTFYGSWQQILDSGGLKPMGRNHVHFALGPALADVLPNEAYKGTTGFNTKTKGTVDENDRVKVISGMRHDAQILIYVDLKRCLEDVRTKGVDMKWWRSENGVVLTEGVDVSTLGTENDGDAEVKLGLESTVSTMKTQTTETPPWKDETSSHGQVRGQNGGDGDWKQKQHTRDEIEMVKMAPMKYWSIVVEVKRGLGVLWRQGEGIVKELPPDLAAKGPTKGVKGGRGRGRGRGR